MALFDGDRQAGTMRCRTATGEEKGRGDGLGQRRLKQVEGKIRHVMDLRLDFESMGAHGCYEQWNVRDTRI
jgi:hypothetical protein